MNTEIKTQVVVIGSGPSGYSAAFRCADLGLETILIERYSNLGGVCLNVGCIPSKSLLHIVKVIQETELLIKHDVISGELNFNLDKMRIWKENAINKLVHGLNNIASMRKIQIIHGNCKFIDKNIVQVVEKESNINITFDYAIIAVGSRSLQLPLVSNDDSRIWDSTRALSLTYIPKRLLIVGGGVIGLEMATIYNTLGSKIDIVEASHQIIPILDKDVAKTYVQHINNKFNLMLQTKITKIETKQNDIDVHMINQQSSCINKCYDAILVAIGRIPNSDLIDISKVGIKIDNLGFICIDKQMRTNIPNIFAIGDVVGHPMLAHKGSYEGHIAAEVIAGKKHYFDPKVIPSIVYTEPEISWVGITEKEAIKKNINYEVAVFPWKASGRAVSSGYQVGMTKLIFEKTSNQIIGGAVVGTNSSELLGEISLAIEMCCDAEDIALTIHAHPTLHESIGLAAKMYEGSITDLFNIKAKK